MRPTGIKSLHIANAVTDGTATFENERSISLLREKVGGDQAAGTGTNHDRSVIQRPRAGGRNLERKLLMQIDLRWRSAALAQSGEEARRVTGDDYFGIVDTLQIVLVAGI